MDCRPPGSSVRGIFQARIPEWVVICFSRESSWPRDWTRVSCIGRRILYHCTTWEAQREREREREVAQSCPTLCDLMDCSLPGSSVHGIFQARVLEWIAVPFSKESSRPRDRTWVSHIVDRCCTVCDLSQRSRNCAYICICVCRASLAAQRIKRLPAVQETQVWSLGWQDSLEKEMATHSSILAWRIPWTEEPEWATVHGVVKRRTWLSDFTSLHFRAVLQHTCDISSETRVRHSCHPLPPLLSWSCQTAGFKSEMAMAEPLCWEVGEFKDVMNFLKLGSVSSFSINLSVLHALQCSDQETMAQQT